MEAVSNGVCDPVGISNGSVSGAGEGNTGAVSCDPGFAQNGADPLCASGSFGTLPTCDPVLTLDHFLCYKVEVVQALTPPPVLLVDQFGNAIFKVKKLKRLCVPVDKNGEGILDETIHLAGYKIKLDAGFFGPVNVTVTNQFETDADVTTVKPVFLLVPSNKSIPPNTGTDLPNPNNHDVDHYKCYKVEKDGPLNISVTLLDQLISTENSGVPLDFVVKKRKFLCNPVDKEGEGIKDLPLQRHLVCYTVKRKPRFEPGVSASLSNQFGFFGEAAEVQVVQSKELCVPSDKIGGG